MISKLAARRVAKLASQIDPIVALMLLLLGGGSVLLMRACDPMCGNDILHEYPSPNGQTKLTVFQRDCGATTDFSTQASLSPANAALPNEAGNVLIVDTDHGTVRSGDGGGPALSVSWISDAQLLLTYCESARVFLAETTHQGIDIRHERSCPGGD